MSQSAKYVTIRPTPNPEFLRELLEESAARHQHLCPRQVLGVRIGLAGLRALSFTNDSYQPRFINLTKRLLTIVETDGCGADGVSIATDCFVGRRTLRVLDFGKVAATLVDTFTGRAVRIFPSLSARELAIRHAQTAGNSWQSYLLAYQTIPDDELLVMREVELTRSLAEILSKPGLRTQCDTCGEEVINEREIRREGIVLCRACAGDRYYRTITIGRDG